MDSNLSDNWSLTSVIIALVLSLQMFEQWIQDIALDKVTLDRIKLCICGHPRVGKSAMRQSLSRPYLQVHAHVLCDRCIHPVIMSLFSFRVKANSVIDNR